MTRLSIVREGLRRNPRDPPAYTSSPMGPAIVPMAPAPRRGIADCSPTRCVEPHELVGHGRLRLAQARPGAHTALLAMTNPTSRTALDAQVPIVTVSSVDVPHDLRPECPVSVQPTRNTGRWCPPSWLLLLPSPAERASSALASARPWTHREPVAAIDAAESGAVRRTSRDAHGENRGGPLRWRTGSRPDAAPRTCSREVHFRNCGRTVLCPPSAAARRSGVARIGRNVMTRHRRRARRRGGERRTAPPGFAPTHASLGDVRRRREVDRLASISSPVATEIHASLRVFTTIPGSTGREHEGPSTRAPSTPRADATDVYPMERFQKNRSNSIRWCCMLPESLCLRERSPSAIDGELHLRRARAVARSGTWILASADRCHL